MIFNEEGKHMKKLLILMIIAALPVTVNAKSKVKKRSLIERDAQINEEMRTNTKLLKSLVSAVKKSGYKCDSISAAEPFKLTFGYTLKCNKYQYEYSIRDQAGNYTVSIN
jgi:hypothetical protein